MMRFVRLCAIFIICTLPCLAQTQHDRIVGRGTSTYDRLVNTATIVITGATPNVSTGNVFKTNNGGATTITNFLNGVDTQEVDLLCGDGNTTVQNNSNIAVTGGTDFTCAVNVGISFRYDASQTKWVQFGGTGSGGGGGTPGAPTNSIQKNSGSGTFVASNISDDNANITLAKPLIETGGGTLSGAFAGSPVFSLTGNEAIKPASTEPVQHVVATGNDANDGLSWGTAKQTVYAALKALPGGDATHAGAGTVLLSGTVNYGGPAANQGFWIMGGPDPNSGSLPSGWLLKSGSAPVNIECALPNITFAHAHTPACTMAGGGQADLVHPAIWLSATTGVNLKNVGLGNFLNTYIKLGIDSNNNRSTAAGGISSVSMDGVSWNHGNCRYGGGPGMDIGSNTFWIYLRNINGSGCSFGELTIAAPGTPGLSRSANVVTVTTTTPHSITAGAAQWITIQNATDTSFNGSYVVASSADNTHFTYAQIGPNATSGNGQVVTKDKAAINHDAGGGSGSGLIFLENFQTNSGGIRIVPGNQGAGMYIKNGDYEGDGIFQDMPEVLVTSSVATSTGTGMNVVVENVEVSDNITPIPGVQIDNTSIPAVIVSRVDLGVKGPALILGGVPNTGASDLSLGHVGFNPFGRLTAGGIDAARRGFSPVSVAYANLASTNPASWVYQVGSGTISTGITALDGTTGAGRITSNSGIANVDFYIANNTPLTVGDTYVFGLWERSNSAGALSGVVTLSLNANGFGSGDTCVGGAQSVGGFFKQISGDGQWIWHGGYCTVATNPVNAGIALSIPVQNPAVMDAYMPIVIKIPVGTKSFSEIFEIVLNLIPYPDTAAAGDVTMMRGQRFDMSTPGNNFFVRHTGTLTADRIDQWPDQAGFVAVTPEQFTNSPRGPFNALFPGAITTTWTGETWTLDKAITVTRVQAQARTAPSGCGVNAILRLSDGSSNVNLTIAAAANDSGAVSQNYAAGAVLTAAVQTAASACATSPGDANLVVQYKMQ